MKYLLIIILLSSCSQRFAVNGHEVKSDQKAKTVSLPLVISLFIIGYSVQSNYYNLWPR